MSIIMKEDHDKILRKVKRRALKIHLAGILITTCLLSVPYLAKLDRDLLQESYRVAKMEFEVVLAKQALLNLLRSKPLSTAQAMDVVDLILNQQEIPVSLVMGLIEVESGFNPKAVSDHGARGLIQVMKVNHKSLLSLNDPVVNLSTGLKYLAGLKRTYGTWEKSLRAYNAGPSNVNSRAIDPYVKLVMTRTEKWERQIGGER